jgi:hypothetical protein
MRGSGEQAHRRENKPRISVDFLKDPHNLEAKEDV